MSKNSKKEGVELKCSRCKYKWIYGGISKWFASCPRCRTSIKVKQE